MVITMNSGRVHEVSQEDLGDQNMIELYGEFKKVLLASGAGVFNLVTDKKTAALTINAKLVESVQIFGLTEEDFE